MVYKADLTHLIDACNRPTLSHRFDWPTVLGREYLDIKADVPIG